MTAIRYICKFVEVKSDNSRIRDLTKYQPDSYHPSNPACGFIGLLGKYMVLCYISILFFQSRATRLDALTAVGAMDLLSNNRVTLDWLGVC